jgi:iron complex outermembrane receptor protein
MLQAQARNPARHNLALNRRLCEDISVLRVPTVLGRLTGAFLFYIYCIFASPWVLAQEELEDEFALLEEELSADEVQSASKHRQSIFWSPSAVTVFTREDIRASGAITLPDLLRRVPGFDVYSIKPSYTLVGARAMTNEYNNLVLLLVDGREDLVELTGFAFWNVSSFDMHQVERVEVIRGPGSALYGANAVAAVVSVTTIPDKPDLGVDIHLQGGERIHTNAFARFRGSADVWDGSLSFGLSGIFMRYLSPSDDDTASMKGYKYNGFMRYRRGRELDLSLLGGIEAGKGDIHLFMGDAQVADVFNPWALAKADFRLADWVNLKGQVYYRRHSGFVHFRAAMRAFGIWIADIPDTQWNSNTLDGQLQLDLQVFERLLFIAGANLRYSTLAGDKLVIYDDDELRGATFFNLQWEPFELLQITAGLRVDFNDLTRLALSPRIVAVLRPWPDQSFRLGYGLAFRKPSFLETRFHMKVETYEPAFREIVDIMAEGVGNPNLDNVKMHSIEAGWQGRFLEDRLRLSVDLFFSLYRDTISFHTDVPLRLGLPDIPRSTLLFENGWNDEDAFGGEAEVVWHAHRDWMLWTNLGLRYVVDRLEDARSLHEPVVRLNLGGRYLPQSGWIADLALHYVSSYSVYLANYRSLLDTPEPTEVGDMLLMIARVGYRFELAKDDSLEIGLTVRAPLGTDNREFPGVPIEPAFRRDSADDFGGEPMQRLVSGYLRGSF